MLVLGQLVNLLSSILTILLTCPNSDTLLCYSNDSFLTVYNYVYTDSAHGYLHIQDAVHAGQLMATGNLPFQCACSQSRMPYMELRESTIPVYAQSNRAARKPSVHNTWLWQRNVDTLAM